MTDNILIFGGTTEGKRTAEILDFVGLPYFYSTKTKATQQINGTVITGAMEIEQITDFCSVHSIRLIVDAAHPYAVNLHNNILKSAEELNIVTIRFERPQWIPDNDQQIRQFDSWQDLNDELCNSNYKQILFLTGVQTIPHFKELWSSGRCFFRILDTLQSMEKALNYGIPEKYLIPMKPERDVWQLTNLAKRVNADILVSKESGDSGFFDSKIEASKNLEIPLWTVRRPIINGFTHLVYSKKEFLQVIYKLQKKELKGDVLRSGYTTGTCVTAAAKACFEALMETRFPDMVDVLLPGGEKTNFIIFPGNISEKTASCTVIKDAGDDPDVTHAAEIGCTLRLNNDGGVHFERGTGIGVVTLPGLQVRVGEPAINPVPRKMVTNMLLQLAGQYDYEGGITVTPYITKGVELAARTFNPRIGVEGGLSILGTSGKVMPYSSEAFVSALQQQVQVAYQTGCREIFASSGRRGELLLRKEFNAFPELAFIHYGNMVGDMLRICREHPFKKITLGMMLAKALKFAEGHNDTHSKLNVFNPLFAASLAKECGYSHLITHLIQKQQIANSIQDIIPYSESEPFYLKISQICVNRCKEIISGSIECNFILLVDEDK